LDLPQGGTCGISGRISPDNTGELASRNLRDDVWGCQSTAHGNFRFRGDFGPALFAQEGQGSAQLRRPRAQSATSACRRFAPSGMRKERSSADGQIDPSGPLDRRPK
jgi:hypothetical protein